MRFERVATAGTAVLALLTLAACTGGAGASDSAKAASPATTTPSATATATTTPSPTKDPKEAEDAQALQLAQKARESVHAAGSMAVDEQQPTYQPSPYARFTTDLQGNCTGEKAMTTGKMLFRKIGDEEWGHPDRTWLEARPSSMDSPEDREAVIQLMLKWHPERNAAVLQNHRDLCAFERITNLIWSDAPATKTLKVTKIGTGTVGQTPVVVLRSAGLLGISTVSVTAEGTPYPVKIEFDSSGTRPSSTVLLSGFGEQVQVPRPRAGEIRDSSGS